MSFAASATAAERWASPGGSGAVCTQANPCSLNTAVEDPSVTGADEVIVTPGTYTITSLLIDDPISIHGQNHQPPPQINGDVLGINVSAAASVSDLRLEAKSLPLSILADGAIVDRVYSRSTESGGNACAISASAVLRNSVCWSSGANSRGAGATVSFALGPETIVLRNITAIGTAYGLAFDYNGAAVTTTVDAMGVVAQGGTVFPNVDVRATADSGGTTEINLERSNYETEFELGNTGGTATITDPGSGTNQTANPLFVNAAAGDFHQEEASPTIDAGDADAWTGPLDFENDDRILDGDGDCPLDAQPDIGADEFTANSTIDCNPPDTFITGPTGTTGPTPTFTLTSSETNSTFECKIDGAAFASCSSPYTTPSLPSGPHTLEVRATDSSGNPDATPASQAFTVDASPPDTSISSGPAGLTADRTPTFGLASNESGSSFECRIDDGAFGSCGSPFTTPALSDGPHTLRVRAIDAVANADPSPATRGFTVDANAPETTITSAPKRVVKSKRRKAKVSLSFGASEAGRFECRLDDEPFAPCTSPVVRKVARGKHVWTVRAIDEAGNADGSPAQAAFKVKRKKKRR